MKPALRRRLKITAAILGALFLIAIIIAFIPGFQHWVAMSQLQKIDPDAKLERFYFTPFSGEIRGFAIQYEDISAELASLDVDYSPFSLLAKHLNIGNCTVTGLKVTLAPKEEAPDEPDAEHKPFPGLLALTETGFKLSCETLKADALFTLPNLEAKVSLSGGGLTPGGTGTFTIESFTLNLPEQEELRRIGVTGTVSITEADSGAVDALGWDIKASAEGELFDEEAILLVAGELEDGGSENEKRDEQMIYPPESIHVTITQPDQSPDESPLFKLLAIFDSATQDFNAEYALSVDNDTIAPFALALDLPVFEGNGKGKLYWSLEEGQGRSSMELDATLTQLERLSNVLATVGRLEVKESHQLVFNTEELTLEEFNLLVTEDGKDPAIDLTISKALTFKLVDFDTMMDGLDGTWLRLQTDIPLQWFDSVLGGFELEGSDLKGTLQFTGNPLKSLQIDAPGPFLVTGARIERADNALLENVTMQLIPKATVSPSELLASVTDLRIRAQDMDLIVGDAKVALDLEAKEGFRAQVEANMEMFARGLVSQQVAAIRAEKGRGSGLVTDAQRRNDALFKVLGPASIKVGVKANAIPDEVTAEKASFLLERLNGDVLAEIDLANSVKALFDKETVQFEGPDSNWLTGRISDAPVALVDAFVDALSIKGGTINGFFAMKASPELGGFSVDFSEPLSIAKLTVAKDDLTLLESVDVELLPSVSYRPGDLSVAVKDFRSEYQGDTLATASLTAEAKLLQLKPQSVSFVIQSNAGLVPLFAQPLAKPYLKSPFKENYTAGFSTEGSTDLKSVRLEKLEASITSNSGVRALDFKATEPLVISTFEVDSLDTALMMATGAGTVQLVALPLQMPLRFVDLVPMEVVDGSFDGSFSWSIKKGEVSIQPDDVFALNKLTVDQDKKPFLDELYFSTKPSITLNAVTAELKAEDIQIRAGSATAEPLAGQFSTVVALEEALPLQGMNGKLSGPILDWFKQPYMPRNTLSSGQLEGTITMQPGGTGQLRGSLTGVGFKKLEPYIESAKLDGTFTLDVPKEDYKASLPVVLQTLDGKTDLISLVSYTGREKNTVIDKTTTGDAVRLGDLEFIIQEFFDFNTRPRVMKKTAQMTTITDAGTREKKPFYEQITNAERKERADQAKEVEKAVVAEVDKTEADFDEIIGDAPPEVNFAKLSEEAVQPKATDPDEQPFWSGLPASATYSFDFDKVVYKGYLTFNNVQGNGIANDERISLEAFSATFHDASMKAKALLDWKQDNMPKPYELTSELAMVDFDLYELFSELAPGEKPRVEGLFKMAANAEGTFPSLEQARNFITFDLELESKSGILRAIPPNSNLAQTASGTAAVFGEVLSYIPTGGLGMGALSRLVASMREVPYNLAALKVSRQTDLNIIIEKMEVRSEQMLIEGRGGIVYEEGVDLFEQKLDLTAAMDARGEMAAILSGLGLMTDNSANNGYWRGFDFRIWGDLTKPKSNFDEIVTQASSGAVTRNVTNPFHGIWSNIHYDGKGPPPAKKSEEVHEEPKP